MQTTGNRKPKAADLVASELRHRIARGELIPGDRLPTEEELMRRLKVGRTTLREGFRILESQGILKVERGRTGGSRVTEPCIDQLAQGVALQLQLERTTLSDLGEARGLIEPWLAARVADHASRKDLGALDDAILAAEKAASENDHVAFAAAATNVHDVIAQRGGNRTLAVVSRVLHEVVAGYYRRATRDSSPSDMFQAARSYRKLHRLLAAGDVEGAREHWRAQMTFTSSRRDPEERLNAFDAVISKPLGKAADGVAAEIRSRMARGELVPGDRLPTEDELMRQFSVARTTLREGMRILESQGILRVERGRVGGARITEPSIDLLAEALVFHLQLERTTFGDLDEARELIEPWLAARLANCATRETLGALEDAIMRAEQAAAASDRVAFAAAVIAVHDTVAEHGGNRTLAVVSRMLHDLTASYYRRALSESAPSDMMRATKSYWRLHRLLAAGDAQGAHDHWRSQMKFTSARRDPEERLNVFDHSDASLANVSFGPTLR